MSDLTFTGSFSLGVLEMTTTSHLFNDTENLASISLKADSTLDISWSLTQESSDDTGENEVGYAIYTCEGTQIGSDSVSFVGLNGAGSFNFPITEDGEYVIRCLVIGGSIIIESFDAKFTVSSTNTMIVNPAVAFYNDSGTIRQLEACPKLLLPLGTESTNNWYFDLALAQSVMSDGHVSNCIGYTNTIGSSLISFVAMGTTDLSLVGTRSNIGDIFSQPSIVMNGSINVLSGENININFNISTTGTDPTSDSSVYVNIFDQSGILIFSNTASWPIDSGNFIKIAPYYGRYTIQVIAFGKTNTISGTTTVTGNFLITSSGIMSVNPVQALYDVGLDCPARLNCS